MTDTVNNSKFLEGAGDPLKETILKRISNIMKNESGQDFYKNILNREAAVSMSGSIETIFIVFIF